MQISSNSLHFVVPSMFMPKKHFFVAPSVCIPKKGESLLAHPWPIKSTKQLFRDVFHTSSTYAGLFGVGQSLRINSTFCLSVCLYRLRCILPACVCLCACHSVRISWSVCLYRFSCFLHARVCLRAGDCTNQFVCLSVCLSVCLYGLSCFLQAHVCLCAGHSLSVFLSVCL